MRISCIACLLALLALPNWAQAAVLDASKLSLFWCLHLLYLGFLSCLVN